MCETIITIAATSKIAETMMTGKSEEKFIGTSGNRFGGAIGLF
jgi:hypothetical protein